jgi:putative oxidoreductase
MKTNYHIALLLFRISIAFTMLIYGATKLVYGNDFIETVVLDYGLPKFFSYGVYVGEIIAPILIIIGFRTKLSGLVFALNCIVAFLLVQIPNVFKLNEFGGWYLGLLFIYIIFGIALFLSGGGKYSVSTSNKWD